ncbi:GNAT family N-acetyltransferase [Tropicimonas sp. IMCC34011]|uniref:GNAT family N-acetyltransferase n=1 Tax=Tropicimonas sp. IMCC34011 TaxID=2248759 RepID=UPI000E23673B|nr:N-acetyltransferase [Tropicimonas sp. IMCC34011]
MAEEEAGDGWEVEALLDTCFAPGREALSSYRLRNGVPPVRDLCLTVRDGDGILAGAIRAWPVRIAGHAAALIGPVAVHPTRQGEGLGAMMVREVLLLSRKEGWRRTLLVGDAPYYGRFGYRRLDGVVMPPPTNPERVLGTGEWGGVAGPVEKWVESAAPGA